MSRLSRRSFARLLPMAFSLACLTATLPSKTVVAADISEAVAVVRALYSDYAKSWNQGGAAPLASPRWLTRYFDPFVAGQLSAKGLDFDPIYDGQDFEISHLSIEARRNQPVLRGTYFVEASFRNFGSPRLLTYQLRPVEGTGKLRIFDIATKDWQLSNLLK